MKLCQWDGKKSFTIQNEAKSCFCRFQQLLRSDEPVVLSFNEVIPEGLCPFAYFSIIPYWVSFKQGARFRWRKNKDDVACQCPKTDGVVFLICRQKKSEKVVITAEVVRIGNCPNKHFPGQIFEISNSYLCPGQFVSFWVDWQKGTLDTQEDFRAHCSICSETALVNKSLKLNIGLDTNDGR